VSPDRQRSWLEEWCNKYNHTMGLMRTLASIVAGVTGVLIFLKLFFGFWD